MAHCCLPSFVPSSWPWIIRNFLLAPSVPRLIFARPPRGPHPFFPRTSFQPSQCVSHVFFSEDSEKNSLPIHFPISNKPTRTALQPWPNDLSLLSASGCKRVITRKSGAVFECVQPRFIECFRGPKTARVSLASSTSKRESLLSGKLRMCRGSELLHGFRPVEETGTLRNMTRLKIG